MPLLSPVWFHLLSVLSLAKKTRLSFVALLTLLLLPLAAAHATTPVARAATREQASHGSARVNARPPVVVDLRSFGAVGDGVTDDAPAFQRALDSLATSADGGGDATLVVPEGSYALLTPVAKNFGNGINSLTIVGPTPVPVPESAGPGRGLGLSAEFVIKVGGEHDALSIAGLANLLIQDVTFIGNPLVGTDARVVVALSEIESAVLRHCEFYGLASLVANGSILYAHHSHLKLEDSAFLGSTTTSGLTTSVVQNTLWRGINISDTRFIDYGNRPDYFSKTPHAAPFSWISIANAAAPDEKSTWREAIIRDVFLDEGGYIGLTARPDFFTPYFPGSGPIDLIHISGLRMNVSNLHAHGLQLTRANRVMVERSFFGWSHNADTAINLTQVTHAIIEQAECVADATTIRADAPVGRLDVVNSIYQTLDSHADITNIVNTAPADDPAAYVRRQYLDALARAPDSAGLFYWSAKILGCEDDAPCVAAEKLALAAYLATQPAADFRISGRVTDEDGQAMPGVSVALTGSQETTVSTDSEGRYQFSKLPTSGFYVVAASLLNHTFDAPSQSFTTPDGDRVANFTAAIDRYSITGRVTNQHDHPVAGATVALSGSASDSVVTGSDGVYTFTGLAAGGAYTLTPSKPHHSFLYPTTWTFNNLTSDQTSPRFTAIPVKYTISGRVAGASGASLGGVRVELTGSGTGAAFTDANGNYSFTVEAGGNYTVTPSRANYTFAPASLSFSSLSKDATANFDGALKNYLIVGHVRDGGSAPIVGVRMVLSGDQTGETTTDGGGAYSFTVRGEGTYTVRPSREDYSFRFFTTGAREATIANIDRNHNINFTAKSSHLVSGRVTLAGGVAGVGGVTIRVNGTQPAQQTTTDAQGNYSIALRAMNNHTLTPAKTNHDFTPQTLSFNQLDDEQTANFTAVKSRHTIGGRVTNASGVALAGVTVALTGALSRVSTTGADGRYSFDELTQGGDYVVAVTKTNYAFTPPTRAVSNLRADHTADFEGALISYRIGGVITSGGVALGGVSVALSGSQSGVAITDAAGEYSFSVLAEGNYIVAPSKTHYTFAAPRRSFDNLGGNVSADFDATLNRHALTGRITKNDGTAFAGVSVALSGTQNATTATDADGNYSFSNLPAGGDYTLVAARTHYTFSPPGHTLADLSATQTKDFNAALNTHTIAGTITDGIKPLGGVRVLLNSDGGTTEALTDEAGKYSFTVDAGVDYTLTASKRHYTFNLGSHTLADLSANRTVDFNATLNRHALTGRITKNDGTAFVGVSVALSGTQNATTTTDADGNYSFSNLPAGGDYTVVAARTHYTFSPAMRTLEDLSSNQTVNFSGTVNTHTIAGTITDGVSPLGGVRVLLSTSSRTEEVLTNEAGKYSFTVDAGVGYMLTPSKINHTFAPASRTLADLSANQTVNFNATLNIYTVAGTITDGVSPLGGVRVVLSGSRTLEALTNDAGNYSFSVDAEGDYTLTPSKTHYVFSPSNRTLARLSGNQTANFSGELTSVQFGEASYRVSEDARRVRLSLTRGGDTSGAARVSYATTNDTASERSDYVAAYGTFHFAPGEVSKTFDIFITDDVFSESDETFGVALGDVTGAAFGARARVSVTIEANDTAEGPNPVAWGAGFDSEFFVRQHYIDFFNREPDASGLSFWKRQIDECGTDEGCAGARRANVSAAFFVSTEFRETGYLVYRFHHAAYGRRIRGTVPLVIRDFLNDVQEIGRGVVVGEGNWQQRLEQNKQAYADAFVSRTDFLALYPASSSAAAYVDALNANTGASLSQAERDALVGKLQSNQITRAHALMEVAEDADFKQRELNRAFVLSQYFGYLRRNPDDAPDGNMDGFNFWLQKLNNHGGDYLAAEMVKAFLTSPEYLQRFGR